MKLDPIMKWLNDARVKIVHQGDLETQSIARVRLIASYNDAAAAVLSGLPINPDALDTTEFQTSPGLPLGKIVKQIMDSSLPSRYVAQSTLSVERSWVDSELPNVELLNALAHIHGFLGEMVEDAHARAGLDQTVAVKHAGITVRLKKVPGRGGRLPCMVTSRAERTLDLSMTNGQVTTGGKSWTIPLDPKTAGKAELRYKTRRRPEPTYIMNVVDWLPYYAENARAILRTGEEHGWFVFFFKGRNLQSSQTLAARDGADKRALAQEPTEVVARNRYDGIIYVGEVWHAPLRFDDEGFALPAVEHPDKTEAVALHAETADGTVSSIRVPFRRRRFGSPVIQEAVTFVYNDQFLSPVRAVWRSWGPSPVSRSDDDSQDAHP